MPVETMHGLPIYDDEGGVWNNLLCDHVCLKYYPDYLEYRGGGEYVNEYIPKEVYRKYCDKCKHKLYFEVAPLKCYGAELEYEELV